jgi:methylglutaconyl-CoA hydratase
MSDDPVLVSVDREGVGWITLNRPRVHNAFNDGLIIRLGDALNRVASDPAVRAIALCAKGRSFSAGADLNWMRAMADYSESENVTDARAAADIFRTLDALSKPTVAVVHGSAFGGGVGLVAACDIAIAAEESMFTLSEVRLGLIPSIIGPYVIGAIGARQARRYFQTAEQFSAAEALRIGLVHQVVPTSSLEETVSSVLTSLVGNSPKAMAAAKTLVRDIAGRRVNDELVEDTSRRIASLRASDEGREGLSAFLEKRLPSWVKS